MSLIKDKLGKNLQINFIVEGTQSDDGTQVQETFKSQYKCNKHNDSGSNRLNVWTSGVDQILLRFSARKTKSARWLISLNVGVYYGS